MAGFVIRGSLAEIDPAVYELTQIEIERQKRRLILIPSESFAPKAVRESLGSVFQNLYAEGYPDDETRSLKEEEILDYSRSLARYRRYADPRYYKGVEYVDVLEALTRRRCAEVFATPTMPADQLWVNVQPLSGAPANNAVYTALINPGDTILGMNLLHGGHLSHGSSVNRSGKWYKAMHYTIDAETQQIDYNAVEKIAKEGQPKVIIAGYSSYPWAPDWTRFREIADSVGAYLLADISHIAGLIAAGEIPSPVGIAHVVTFTTHKTLFGPRGACIITHDASIGKKIDKGVFPGEQGGPHAHFFAAVATTFKLARTDAFKQLERQIIKNCAVLTNQLKERGFRIPFGGTNTHLANLDCKTVKGPDGTILTGDIASRILDLVGIVSNRNTIPGDKTAMHSTGVRFGTPWVTGRGLDEKDMVEIANIMADVLLAAKPYTVETRQGLAERAKIDFDTLENAKLRVRALAEKANVDEEPKVHFGYPHFYYIDDTPQSKGDWVAYDIYGDNIQHYTNYVFSSDVETLQPGQSQRTSLSTPKGVVQCVLARIEAGLYRLSIPSNKSGIVAAWLRDLSDGFVAFDDDLTRRIPGPVIVVESDEKAVNEAVGEAVCTSKPYYIGMGVVSGTRSLPPFKWEDKESSENRRTPLFDTHVKMGAKMVPFAGWEMPVWYSSVTEEHAATRQAAGLFDVSHMGVYQAEGPQAVTFLDSVCGNDISMLGVGESCYTHLLDPHANVIDDLLVYRRAEEKYLVVVNASNDDKDWAWLNAVREGTVMVDEKRPWVKAYGRNVRLRNLRDPKEGKDMKLDIALQGPRSRDILLALGCDADTRKRIMGLMRTDLCEAVVGGFELVVSRTGYTGEKMAFELFVHPNQVVDFWNALLKAGEAFGLKPCGLGARDSLRTEAGLPLYGHEMAGELGLGVSEAGFGSYVKVYKPWFVGREAFIAREQQRQGVVARFRFNEKGVRMAHLGDPVLDAKGRAIGKVCSCAIDGEGYLTGQAFVEIKSAIEETPIYIYQGSPKEGSKAPAQLKSGERVTLPSAATIVSRFPKPPKK